MPSEGRAKYNNTYYIANADDISYNNKLARRDAKTIICGCGSSIKDYSSSKSVHKKTNKHQIYEITMDIIDILCDGNVISTKAKAKVWIQQQLEQAIGYRLETVADKYKAIIKLRNKARRLLVEGMDEKPKPVVKEKPKPVENVVISTEPVTPHIPPSTTFDPLSMMGTSNGDIDGL
mgnify:CR=1 FL=1|tara:strand:+ start:94 stop:624 length:531 start_codon:yes stop_codon:yes gene_type:complete